MLNKHLHTESSTISLNAHVFQNVLVKRPPYKFLPIVFCVEMTTSVLACRRKLTDTVLPIMSENSGHFSDLC